MKKTDRGDPGGAGEPEQPRALLRSEQRVDGGLPHMAGGPAGSDLSLPAGEQLHGVHPRGGAGRGQPRHGRCGPPRLRRPGGGLLLAGAVTTWTCILDAPAGTTPRRPGRLVTAPPGEEMDREPLRRLAYRIPLALGLLGFRLFFWKRPDKVATVRINLLWVSALVALLTMTFDIRLMDLVQERERATGASTLEIVLSSLVGVGIGGLIAIAGQLVQDLGPDAGKGKSPDNDA